MKTSTIAPGRGVSQAIGLVALGLCLSVVLRGAQETKPQQPTFRSGVDIARVTVRVLDRDRRPIRGLGQEDFTVVLNGVPQRIVTVAAVDELGPVTPPAPWMRDIASDVASNSVKDARLIVIILDDAQLGRGSISSTSGPWSIKQVKLIARTIIDQLGPGDLAAIVFSADNRAPQDFTADRQRLLATVERYHPTALPGGLPALYSMNTLSAALAFLRGVPEHRSAIFWIGGSDGKASSEIVAPMLAPTPGQLGSSVSEKVGAATVRDRIAGLVGSPHVASVPVYPISAAGLQAPIDPESGRLRPPGMFSGDDERSIASVTGGRSVARTNAPALAIPVIFRELSLHYVIGYESTEPLADGRFRRVQVRVNRPNVIIEPPDRGYFAPRPRDVAAAAAASRRAPATTTALSGLVPVTDTQLRLAAAAVAEPASMSERDVRAAVTLALGVDLPATANAADDIQLELRVFDGEGRKEIDVKKLGFRIAPQSAARERSFDLLTSISLKPGRYNLRMSAHSSVRDESGSVYTDITIPDYAKSALSASDVVISAPTVRTATPVSALAGLLPVLPTTARAFATTDRATAFLRIYWGRNRPSTPVTITATITNADNRQVSTRTTPVANSGDNKSLRFIDFRFDLPLRELPEGEYLLTLRARPATRTELVRHVRFRVH